MMLVKHKRLKDFKNIKAYSKQKTLGSMLGVGLEVKLLSYATLLMYY